MNPRVISLYHFLIQSDIGFILGCFLFGKVLFCSNYSRVACGCGCLEKLTSIEEMLALESTRLIFHLSCPKLCVFFHDLRLSECAALH